MTSKVPCEAQGTDSELCLRRVILEAQGWERAVTAEGLWIIKNPCQVLWNLSRLMIQWVEAVCMSSKNPTLMDNKMSTQEGNWNCMTYDCPKWHSSGFMVLKLRNSVGSLCPLLTKWILMCLARGKVNCMIFLSSSVPTLFLLDISSQLQLP